MFQPVTVQPAVAEQFQRQAKAAGLQVIRLHDARHTAATILLDSGAAVSAVAKWLGHDPAVLRVYGHLYLEALEAAELRCSARTPGPPAPSPDHP